MNFNRILRLITGGSYAEDYIDWYVVLNKYRDTNNKEIEKNIILLSKDYKRNPLAMLTKHIPRYEKTGLPINNKLKNISEEFIEAMYCKNTVYAEKLLDELQKFELNYLSIYITLKLKNFWNRNKFTLAAILICIALLLFAQQLIKSI